VVISASKSASKVAEDLRKQRPVYIDRCGKSKEVAIMLGISLNVITEYFKQMKIFINFFFASKNEHKYYFQTN
jgi:hypothetical protein